MLSVYRRCRFWQEKIIFSDEAHFYLGMYVNKQNCCIRCMENSHADIEKLTHPKRVNVRCGFWFSSKMSKEWPLLSMAIVIGPFWKTFCSQKLKRRILATFGFNSTALHASQSKLHSMFCALLLKIALSASELMSFGHLGVAIWHRWTINCEVPSKISVTPRS